MGDHVFGTTEKQAFLRIVRETGLPHKTIRDMGFSNNTLRRARKSDPDFDSDVKDAQMYFSENVLEKEAIRRAINGWKEPVFFKGMKIGEVEKKSDRMLELLLKKSNPAFRDKIAVDAKVSGGVIAVPGMMKSEAEWSEVFAKTSESNSESDPRPESE